MAFFVMKNVTEFFFNREHDTSVACVYGDTALTSAELIRKIKKTVSVLNYTGVRSRDVVAVAVENPLGFLITTFALLRLGALVVPFPERYGEERRVYIQEKLKFKHLIRDIEDTFNSGERINVLSAPHILSDSAQEMDSLVFIQATSLDTPAYCDFTSGSTGFPKIVVTTHGQYIGRLEKSITQLAVAPTLIGVDLRSSYGLKWIVRGLATGSRVILVDNMSPENMLRNIAANNVERIVCMPGVVSELYDALVLKSLPDDVEPILKGIRHWCLGGSKVPTKIRLWIRRDLSSSLVVTYGTTECGRIATFIEDEKTFDDPDFVGDVMPEIAVEIVDEDERPVPRGANGIIRIRAPHMAYAYFSDPIATAKHFRSGWFYPGDCGRLVGDNRLYLTGRIDDVINIGGTKLDPSFYENKICQHPGVLQAFVALLEFTADSSRVVCAIKLALQVDQEDVRQYVNEIFDGRDMEIFFFESIKLNRRGKIDRVACKAELARVIKSRERFGEQAQ